MGEEIEYIKALHSTSEYHLKEAERAFESKSYADVILHAALSVENMENAFTIRLGGKPSKTHRPSAALTFMVHEKRMKLDPELGNAIEEAKWLEAEVIKSRYPVKKGGKWFSPHMAYDHKSAEKALKDASKVFNTITEFLSGVI